MSKECAVCGKTPKKSASRTFSNVQNIKRQSPNLQSVRADINGSVKTIKVCTSCIKAGKVKKA